MAREVVEALVPVPPGVIVDATVGGGGHAMALLDARDDLDLVGIDRDPEAVTAAISALAPYGGRARVVQGGFERLAAIVGDVLPLQENSEGEIVGVLFDLGVSSPQLDRPERGFSYRMNAPLDMRMDSGQALTAAQVVNEYTEGELTELIRRFGEERYARSIARRIVATRPLSTTRELVDTINDAIPARARRRGGHPARRTFQAIRMEVNRELPNLAAGLDDAVRLIAPGGRIVTIAYHSLEDRLVKDRFVDLSEAETIHPPPPVPAPPPGFRCLARRARRPIPEEIAINPRARSARLRVLERLPDTAVGSTG